MTSHNFILRKVGFALIIFGLIDIALMIYFVSEGKSYSSSFNIFAVIAGICLIRGSLRMANLVAWFAAFIFTGLVGTVVFVFPFVMPMGLLMAKARLDPVGIAMSGLMGTSSLVLLGWTYRCLRSPPVLSAIAASGRGIRNPKWAIGLGVVLVTVLAILLNMTLNGVAGSKSIELARMKLGSGYHYVTQSIRWSGDHVDAVVVAYNDHEIRHVPVEWKE